MRLCAEIALGSIALDDSSDLINIFGQPGPLPQPGLRLFKVRALVRVQLGLGLVIRVRVTFRVTFRVRVRIRTITRGVHLDVLWIQSP